MKFVMNCRKKIKYLISLFMLRNKYKIIDQGIFWVKVNSLSYFVLIGIIKELYHHKREMQDKNHLNTIQEFK